MLPFQGLFRNRDHSKYFPGLVGYLQRRIINQMTLERLANLVPHKQKDSFVVFLPVTE